MKNNKTVTLMAAARAAVAFRPRHCYNRRDDYV